MTAALAQARALGMNLLIAAELLPEIEPFAVRGIDDALRSHTDG